MIYRRHIPREELFSAQLELLMQNGRLVMVVTHLVGVVAVVAMLWPYIGLNNALLCAAGFLILLLVRSLHMSNALVGGRYRSAPRSVYWQLILGAMATGALWAGIYIWAAQHVPVSLQHVLLLLIIAIASFSIGFAVIIREYFLAQIFTSLWPIAWWCIAHYWQQPHNLVIGLSLLAFCAVLMLVCNQNYATFRNLIAMNWEREHTAQELGNLSGSLKNRNRELSDARQQLANLANVDELTGLGNRRLINRVLQQEINRARRGNTHLSVIMLDVDNFKSYNDTFGHPAGDVVLQRLGGLMRRACNRAGEVVARYGGEEFLLVLPGADKEAALHTATRLAELVREEEIPHAASDVAPYITLSQGVVSIAPRQTMHLPDVLHSVDSALYEAKRTGRNRWVVREGGSELP